MSLGPVMLDLCGTDLDQEEVELLKHPLVGGVILFARNFDSPEQTSELTRAIHRVREPRLLIAVDQEGGRVQRFKTGMTRLPACRTLGEIYDNDHRKGLEQAEQTGWLMASELLAIGVDFSFSPVLDVDKGISKVIGDRAFHRQHDCIVSLTRHYIEGMKRAGMMAVGKHFPGHGSVYEDSHHSVPVDKRSFADIQMDDMLVFERLIHAGIAAIMPAHVIYPDVDNKPAGFSARWLKDILRGQLGFQGVIFSDDISMAGAEVAGNYTERTKSALHAGCDMVLICNNREGAVEVLDTPDLLLNPVSQVRLMRMHGKQMHGLHDLKRDPEWQKVSVEIARLERNPELGLGDDAIY